jgi:hypothetical protein
VTVLSGTIISVTAFSGKLISVLSAMVVSVFGMIISGSIYTE